jgi:sporulation protein YlmC with PRC-barrel domain
MARTMQPQELIDSAVVDPEGNKIGKVGNVYLADATHQPEWITVKTGLFGTKESFVPLSGARTDKDGIHVQVDKDSVSTSTTACRCRAPRRMGGRTGAQPPWAGAGSATTTP